MKLDTKDRYIISNQLRILEALYPDDAETYKKERIVIENGYSLNYEWITEHLSTEMSVDDCQEVLNILQMYRAITFSTEKLPPIKEAHTSSWVKFRGFDGNNESKQRSYAIYLIMDLDRFEELKLGEERPAFNSHMPTLDKYRKMLDKWLAHDKELNLTESQLIDILNA